MLITSLQNQRVKDAIHLRDARQREKQDRILIDGARELRRAMTAKVRMVQVFFCESLCRSEDAKQLLASPPQGDCEIVHVDEAVFEKLAFGQRAEGVLGVAEMPHPTLDSLNVPEDGIIAILEGVEKPGNVGAVLRSADASGLSAVIIADGRTDLFNPNAIRASLGTIFSVPVCEASSADTLAWLRRRKSKILAARVDGAVPYSQIDYRGPVAIAFGSEASGLTPVWTADDIQAVQLPMMGMADSLNVSVTAAVLFYEALRQRSKNSY
jgi:TrmH family RNA methyltransferase